MTCVSVQTGPDPHQASPGGRQGSEYPPLDGPPSPPYSPCPTPDRHWSPRWLSSQRTGKSSGNGFILPPVPRGVCSPRQPTCGSHQLPSYCGCKLMGTDPGLAPLCYFCGSATRKGQLCPESWPHTQWEPWSLLPRPTHVWPCDWSVFPPRPPQGHAALYVGPQSRWRGSSSP